MVSAAAQVDEIMQRGSAALADGDCYAAVTMCARALELARGAEDAERMARICLPLQEARRMIRQRATDTGRVVLVRDEYDVPRPLEAGCYLIQPPLIGADAATLRETGFKQRTAVYALAREPLTRDGRWPIVGVGEVSVRTKIDPPVPLDRAEDRMSKDRFGESAAGVVPLDWFERAGEALGDAAIAKLKPEHSPWWHVDDLLDALGAVPEHEKLHQRLERACREAMRQPVPTERRPLPMDNPFGF